MNYSATLTTKRQSAIELFNDLRTRAARTAFLRQLTRRADALADFSAALPCLNPNRSYAGVQAIRLEQITGSVGRSTDFDSNFRPLKGHLRERWVSNYLHMQRGNNEAIRVFQVGDRYYVEDGHHRVSVARATGMAFIEAEVWQYHPKSFQAAAVPQPQRPAESWQSFQPASSCPCPAES
jgi:hypothetical protein